MTPDLVIFDCDGVLVDTEPTTNRIISDSLSELGLTVAPDQVHAMFAGGTMQSVADEAASRGATIPPLWIEGIYEQVFAALREHAPVIPGVIALLDRLEDAGIAIAVASNGPMAKMEISLGPSGLWDRLAGRIYSGHDFGPKPAPDMLLHAMIRQGASAARTVMIDDMPAGWRAAEAAGVRALAYVADGGLERAVGDDTGFVDMADVPALLGLDDADSAAQSDGIVIPQSSP